MAVQPSVSTTTAAYFYNQKLKQRKISKQVGIGLLLTALHTLIAAATGALAVLQLQPIILIYTLQLSEILAKNNHEMLVSVTVGMIITYLILAILNAIVQIVLRNNDKQFISRNIQKSIPYFDNWFFQSCHRKLYLIIHFVNILRLINGKVCPSLWSAKDDKESRHVFVCKKILTFFGICISALYIVAIVGGLCSFIFFTLRILLITSTFLICYSSYFSKLIIITVPYIIGIKVTYQTYMYKKQMIIRTIRRSRGKLKKKIDQMLNELTLNDDGIQGNVTIYMRINHAISGAPTQLPVMLFHSSDGKSKLQIYNDKYSQPTDQIIAANANNNSTVVKMTELIINSTSSEINEIKDGRCERKSSFKQDNNPHGKIIRINIAQNDWKVFHKEKTIDNTYAVKYAMSISRKVPFKVNVASQNTSFDCLNVDPENKTVKVKWIKTASASDDEMPALEGDNLVMPALNVNVPEIVFNVQDSIYQELAKIIQQNSEINEAGKSFQIKIDCIKTENGLTLKLPSSNNDHFYNGRNIDLLPVITHIGNYLYAFQQLRNVPIDRNDNQEQREFCIEINATINRKIQASDEPKRVILFHSNDDNVKLAIGRDSNTNSYGEKLEHNKGLQMVFNTSSCTIESTDDNNRSYSLFQSSRNQTHTGIIGVDIANEYWKIFSLPQNTDISTNPNEYSYSIPRNIPFKMQTNINNPTLVCLDCSPGNLEVKWSKSEQKNEYNPINYQSFSALQIEIPEILSDLNNLIHYELVDILQPNLEINKPGKTFKISVECKKTNDTLNLTLPPSNDSDFYHGCNIDLLPVATHIANYLGQLRNLSGDESQETFVIKGSINYKINQTDAPSRIMLYKSNNNKVKLVIGKDKDNIQAEKVLLPVNQGNIAPVRSEAAKANMTIDNRQCRIYKDNDGNPFISFPNDDSNTFLGLTIPSNVAAPLLPSDGGDQLSSHKRIIRIDITNEFWKIFEADSNDINTRPKKYSCAISRSIPFEVTTDIDDGTFCSFNFEDNTLNLRLKCATSGPNTASIPAFEIDVPEMLFDIKHSICKELATIIQQNSEVNNAYETFRINVNYRKTKNDLALILPASNNENFYDGCNIDLLPVATHIGNHLHQHWDLKIFREHLHSINLYHDVSAIGDIDCIGIPKKLYDYICNNVTHLTMSFYVALSEIIFGTIFYGILIAGIFAFTSVSAPVVFLNALSKVPISLTVISLILGFITIRRYDEKTMKEDILDVLFSYKRGYKLFCTPPDE